MKTLAPLIRVFGNRLSHAAARSPVCIRGLVATGCFLGFPSVTHPVAAASTARDGGPIDRQALVTRHNPILRGFDPENPLSVGNGEFAFTADATGLQTFAEAFTNTTPLGTLSHWGWHSFPNPEGWSIERFHFNEFYSHGRKVGYADVPHNQRTPEINWLRGNPHRLHLGRIGLVLTKADGRAARTNDLSNFEQTLDLWNGALLSRFQLEGRLVEVQTVCHPEQDLLAVRVLSPLLKEDRVAIKLHFPYGTGATVTADWSKPEAHTTKLSRLGLNRATFNRQLDDTTYYAAAVWSSNAILSEVARHEYRVALAEPKEIPAVPSNDALEFVCAFSPGALTGVLPTFEQTRAAASEHWNHFWRTGGAMDLSASLDPRWRELERRIVLSQYLTAIQCAGSLPPQETGLTYNSWEGKFHLEMHWWHAAHFALWDRLPMLERSLGYYQAILPRAQGTAKRQGYTGARWPKMTCPSGAESPSPVGPFLIWQQPHPIFYAELCYRARTDRVTLEKFQDVVSQTAEFMSSYAAWDEAGQRYVLGPPLQCAQEIFPKDRTINPTFELTYWRWGLETAQQWRQRLGLPRVVKWDQVLRGLARPPVADDKYLFAETAPDTYSQKKWNHDHPSVTAALGLLPGPGIEPEPMRRTLHWITDNWNWPEMWGWDYPMVAMCAARLGEPERAVDALLLDTPKNRYRLNGHNYQRPGLTIYLPGNGGLLYAAAMMAAGWEGAPNRPTPGFPDNGRWTVRYEGLRKAP
jgi:hypothetical protein